MIHADIREPLKNNIVASLWPSVALRGFAVLLAVLFLGPLIAPLFQATRLPLVADSGALARDLLARYICPTPAKSYVLLGFPMAVCARCWGATIGLWAAWLLAWPMASGQRATFAPVYSSFFRQWLDRYWALAW